MKFPIVLTLPQVFGWRELQFSDRLKLMAFLAQGGAGVVMTAFAGYTMLEEARFKAVWPVFYLGAMAMIMVGIIVTGFAGLLIARTLEVRGPGGFVLKSQDASAAASAIAGATATAQALPAQPITPTPLPSDGKQDVSNTSQE